MDKMTRLGDTAAVAQYVSGRLSHGWTLSRALLRTWDFSRGSIWTTVHQALGPHDGLDFVQGGKLAAVKKRGLDEPEPLLARFIRRRLSSSDVALVVEDELRRKGDPPIHKPPGRTAFVDRQVYCFLPSSEATLENVQDVLLRTFAPFLNVMVLVSDAFADEIPEDGTDLSPEVLDRAAEAATTLVVGAYDEEAHVVWVKD